MEYANHLQEYAPAPTKAEVADKVAMLKAAAAANCNTEVYKLCLSAVDLTTLSCEDSAESVTAMARRAAEFYMDYPTLGNVASVCVYPPFVENYILHDKFRCFASSLRENLYRLFFPLPKR